jgi:hypothetical protein
MCVIDAEGVCPIPKGHIHEEKAQLAGEPGQVVWEEYHNRNIATAELQKTFVRIPPPLVSLTGYLLNSRCRR